MLKAQLDIFTCACDVTMHNHDSDQLMGAITMYATEGDANYFTGAQGARDNVKKYIKPEDVEFMLRASVNYDRFLGTVNMHSNCKSQSLEYVTALFIRNMNLKKMAKQNQHTG